MTVLSWGHFMSATSPVAGANMWVTNGMSNTVSKVRCSDGTVLGNYSTGAASGPIGVVFDGTNIWVSLATSYLVKLRTSDGTILQSVFVQSGGFGLPEGLAFDGTYVWAALAGANAVAKVKARDGTVIGYYAVGAMPEVLAFDGTHIWAANTGTNTVTALKASDGSVFGAFTVGSGPTGLRWREYMGIELI